MTQLFCSRPYSSYVHASFPALFSPAPFFSAFVMGLYVICVMVLCGLVSAPAHAGAIDDLRRFLKETRSLEAEFTQTVTETTAGTPKFRVSRGSMAYQKPGQFRWEAAPMLIVGDGRKVWLFDQELQQVTVKKMNHALGATPAALLTGNASLDAFRTREDGEQNGLFWASLEPKDKEAAFTRMRFGFTAKGELKSMELLDLFGQVIIFQLNAVRRNPSLPASRFTFTPPPGADLLEE